MESFLAASHELSKCFNQYNVEQAMNMSKQEHQTLCLDEKIKLNSILFSNQLLTSNLINERLNVLEQREKEATNARRKFVEG